MIEFVREVFKRLMIPAAIGYLWFYADLRRQADGYLSITWLEGPAAGTGNPCTATFHPVFSDGPEPSEPLDETADARDAIKSLEDAHP